MRAQYPQDMTIVLQHQFWDLAVTEQAFEVGLSFGGIPERVAVPFEAVTAFYDPAVQFGFQFEAVDSAAAEETSAGAQAADKSTTAPKAVPPGDKPESLPAPAVAAPSAPSADGAAGSGEVVRLDRFRKK
jgi:hypothetical protein